jgi:hypothetical protein
MRRTMTVILSMVSMAACTPQSGPGTTTVVPSTSTSVPVTTTSVPATTTTLHTGPELPVALDAMPDTWVEAFTIPYGETPETLGTHLVGDGEGLLVGPDYGAQAPDGSWWFLDTGKSRLAHFSETGDYLGEVVLPESMLSNGAYFQYQLPRVLSDGTLLASRVDAGRTTFLRLRHGNLDTFTVPMEMIPIADDGTIVYGFSFDEESSSVALVPQDGVAGVVDWFFSRGGHRFRVAGGASGLLVELPDASPPRSVELDFSAAEVGGPVYLSVEVATGSDDTIHLFLLGFPDRDESLQLAGYLTVSADGEVSAVEPIRNPFTVADPASPARLGVRPGTNDVTFMVVDVDGVTVYVRRSKP